MSNTYIIFDTSILNTTEGELVKTMDDLLNDIAPEGKSVTDFTGGYIQQLKNSTRFTAFFGTKKNSSNKDTVQVAVEDNEMDLMYIMLKTKIHDMKNAKLLKPKLSLSERLLQNKEDSQKPWSD